MRSFVTAAIAAIEAVAVACAGLLIVAVPAALIWIVTFGFAAEPATIAAAVSAVWLLAHGVPLEFSLSAEAALGLGLDAQALSFGIGLIPLGVTLITAGLAIRAGWRFAGRGGSGAAGALGGTIGFGIAAFVVALVAEPLIARPTWAAAAVPAAIYGACSAAAFAVRAARDEHAWWTAALRRLQQGVAPLGPELASVLPARAGETLRLAAAAVAGAVGLAALALAAALVVGYPRVVALAQGLQLDALGSVLLFIAQLALLPIGVIWALGWETGAGFALGEGTSVTPFETLVGPLPSLPVLGAVPAGWGAFGAIAPALVVLVGVGIGAVAGRRGPLRRGTWAAAVATPICAGLLAGLAIAGLAALGTGALGPGRLAVMGSDAWLTGGLAAAQLGGGMLLGVIVGRVDAERLAARVGERVRDGAAAVPGGAALVSAVHRVLPGERAAADLGDVDPGGAADVQETAPLDTALAGLRDAETPFDAHEPLREERAGRGEPPAADPEPADPEPADPGPADPAPDADALDAEALIRAYSWDGPGPDAAPEEPEHGRGGLRPPWRRR